MGRGISNPWSSIVRDHLANNAHIFAFKIFQGGILGSFYKHEREKTKRNLDIVIKVSKS